MSKSRRSHAAPHSLRTLDGVVVSRRGSATAPSSALPAHALSGARMHDPLDFLIWSTTGHESADQSPRAWAIA